MWQPALTVLISAVTAALVTLVVEYLARPRLEVRKDRILETARTWRDLDNHIAAMLGARAFAHLHSPIPWPLLCDYLRDLAELLETCERTALGVQPRGVMPLPGVLSGYRELLADIHDAMTPMDSTPDGISSVLYALQHDLMQLRPIIWKHTWTSRADARNAVRLFDAHNLSILEFPSAKEAVRDLLRRL